MLINEIEKQDDFLYNIHQLPDVISVNKLPISFLRKMDAEVEKQYNYIADVRKKINREEDLEIKDNLEEKERRYKKNIEGLKVLYIKDVKKEFDIREEDILFAISESERRIINKLSIMDVNLDNIKNNIIDKIGYENKYLIECVVSRLEKNDLKIIDIIYKEIEDQEIAEDEMRNILSDINSIVAQIKDEHIKSIIAINKKKDSINTKFKLIIPIIPMLLNMEQELTVNNALKRFLDKWRRYII